MTKRFPHRRIRHEATSPFVFSPPLPRPSSMPGPTGKGVGQAGLRVDEQVQRAIRSLRAGRLNDAIASLDLVLRARPDHAPALNCLGVACRMRGELPRAIDSYRRAVQSDPGYAEAYNNLGIALEASGDNSSAADQYRRALQIRPNLAAAHNNLGNVLTKLGRCEEAIACFEQALTIQTKFPAALNNLGLAFRELGHRDRAEDAFRRALAQQPSFAEAHMNLGNVLRDNGELPVAIECYRTALRHRPKSAPARCCLGHALLDSGQILESVQQFEQALQSHSQCAEAHFGLAQAARERGDLDEAIRRYREAVACRPQYAEAHNNLGNVLASRNRWDEAIEAFRTAVAVKPDYLVAHNNLGNLFRLQERTEEAAACYAEVLDRQPPNPLSRLRLTTLCPSVFPDRDAMEDYYASTLAAWTSLHGACSYASLSDLLSAANEPPFNLQFHHRDVRPLKEAYASIFRYVGPDRQPRRSGGRIRIACLVTLQHEVGFLRLIWDTLKRLDSDAFELIILCMSSAVSKFRAAMRNRDVTVVPIPEQPNRIIEAVSEERPDILYYFEVGTDAINYFLPFFRIAPVQCTSWGIQVTSGIPNVDYYLSNELVEPADGQDHYSEKLICARTLLSYQLPVRRPAPGKTRAAFGFSAEHDVYLLPQHLGKFHPDFDPALADILRRDPAGLIAIISDRFGHGANKLRERFHAVMPDVSNRVVFLPKQTVPDYLSLLDAADVLLDPPHFGGVTTTYDSLSLDKPIVTLPSAFHRGRYTYGCYRKMQLDDCVAVNLEDYVEKALKLGRHADYREFVVGRIREAKGRLFEDADAVRELERIFRLLLEEASP